MKEIHQTNVCLGMAESKVYDPFFFEESTVPGTVYLDMLKHFLELLLLTNGSVDALVFQ